MLNGSAASDPMAYVEGAGLVLPGDPIPTGTVLDAIDDRISPDLRRSVEAMGISARHAAIADYPAYLRGDGVREFAFTSTDLATAAVERCLGGWAGDPDRIDLVIAVTNTADRPLPCLGYEVMARLKRRLPDGANVLNLQNMGCSSFLKAVEIAGAFLGQNPEKRVLIVVVEVLTGLADRLTARRYRSFREIVAAGDAEAEPVMRDMQRFLFATLFGDAAVAFVLGREPDEGLLSVGPIAHATNLDPADTEILRMNDSGIHVPGNGVPYYEMANDVPRRGAVYVSEVLSRLARKYRGTGPFAEGPNPRFDFYNIHTGSKKILHGVFRKLDVDEAGEQARESFDVLDRYANTSACSVGLMLARRCQSPSPQKVGLVVAFGVGFSASAAVICSRPHH